MAAKLVMVFIVLFTFEQIAKILNIQAEKQRIHRSNNGRSKKINR